jgi:hypothetical protein
MSVTWVQHWVIRTCRSKRPVTDNFFLTLFATDKMDNVQRDFHSSNLEDFELLRRPTQGATRTLSSNPNSSKSLMNIFPARIGPTVCELLGPTVTLYKRRSQ